MSVKGLSEEEILVPLSWPSHPWEDHFEFVPEGAGSAEMSEAEGTLVSYLDVQQFDRLRAEISTEIRGRGKGMSVRIKLVGVAIRRCVLSGELMPETIEVTDRFDFIKPAKSLGVQKRMEAQLAEDLGTGLEEGPDIWDEDQAPTLVGLIADALEEVLVPVPQIEGASMAGEFANDPVEGELAEKMHPFAALKALKKE